MGLVDRVKKNVSDTVELAKDGLEEVKELRDRREVAHMYGDLGKKAYQLIERGELTHAELDADVREIRRALADYEYVKGTGSSTRAGATAPTRDDI